MLIYMYFVLACIDHWNIYNRLVIACIVKIVTEVKCLCFTSEKASLSPGFLVSHRLLLSACAATNRAI